MSTNLTIERSQVGLFILKTNYKRVENFRKTPTNGIEDRPNVLEGGERKILIPSKTLDNYTRLEVLPGLKLSRHTDTSTVVKKLTGDL